MVPAARKRGVAFLWMLPFGLLAAVYAFQLGIEVIEVDSAQYAHIAEEMLTRRRASSSCTTGGWTTSTSRR